MKIIKILTLHVLLFAYAFGEKPNILWLTSEDNNVTWLGCYGNENASTPNIDNLAKEGFQYMNAFANAPVCAPSRSTWITGINAISMGTQHMRSRYEIPHSIIKYYPDALKKNGYYCANSRKTDFNIGGREDSDCWDSSTAHKWETLKNNQPFFQVINIAHSHESRAQGSVENTKHDPAKTKLRKYHPDIPDIRKNYAKYHDSVSNMDNAIGLALAELEKLGLAENTIVIYCSDHGGVLPRSKRFLFDSGIHCPLIIKIPEKLKHLYPADQPGTKIDRLVSFVDMPKTWLSITNSEIPSTMQGKVFLGENTETEQDYHFAFRGRMDERNDNQRAVRDKQFLYIRNYMPYAPWGQHLDYLWKMKATQAWEAHTKAGKGNVITDLFFSPKPYTEELYDTKNDPDNINNLINSPEHVEVIKRMSIALTGWQKEIHDSGLLPEADLVKRAADNNTTIYELVRNRDLYDINAYLEMSDLALQKNPINLPRFINALKSSDAGVRYWGIVGCFLLDQSSLPAKELITSLLKDDSHEVKAMTAWLTINLGETQLGLDTLSDMLTGGSYATLKILNILDWLGDAAKPTLYLMKSIKLQKYEERMRNNLLTKYNIPNTVYEKKKKK